MSRFVAPLEKMPLADANSNAGFGALETARGTLPLVALEVKTQIADLTAECTIRQTFRNSLAEPLEATYIFPLPPRAAVTQFRMMVADRVIDGELKERGAAREDYQRAIQSGHRAAIAEEDRSGVFNIKVGNIPAHEQATVELKLVGPLQVADGEATYRFPLVVAPRYTSGIPLEGPSVGDGTALDTDEVPDASRVTPPVLLEGFPNPVRLSLEVQIDPLAIDGPKAAWSENIRCSLHSVILSEGPPWMVRLQPAERLNRDFILRFPVAQASVATSLRMTPAADGKPGYFALTFVPPAADGSTLRPRDIVFVLDRSGSMQGWKITAARRTVARMIESLVDQDRFAVLAFDDRMEWSNSTSDLVAATDANRWSVYQWLQNVEARGGTELGPALIASVKMMASTKRNSIPNATSQPLALDPLPIVVLITDGQVTGEDAILRRLAAEMNEPSRVPNFYTVGIDKAVNEGLLTRLASFTSGRCELVESEQRLDEVMCRIHRMIGTPVLTDVRLEPLSGDWIVDDVVPSRLPDLFAGHPLTIHGRHLSQNGELRLRVHALDIAQNAWSTEVSNKAAPVSLLASMWGRAKVRDLEDLYASGSHSTREALMKKIVSTSLETHVLSRFTAYVAVDQSEVVNKDGVQHQIVQPVEMSQGWDAEAMLLSAGFGPAGFVGAMRASMKMSKSSEFSRGLSEDDQDVADARLMDIDACDLALLGSFSDDRSSSVDKIVYGIIADGVEASATEIRIEPFNDRIALKYLINGKLVELDRQPLNLLAQIVERIRKLAKMNSSDREGEYVAITSDARKLKFRVTITSTEHGESVLMVLDPAQPANVQPKAKKESGRRKKFWT